MPRPQAPVKIEVGRIYGTGEVCRALGWNRWNFLQKVHAGRIPVIKGGKEWKYMGEDILALRQSLEVAS